MTETQNDQPTQNDTQLESTSAPSESSVSAEPGSSTSQSSSDSKSNQETVLVLRTCDSELRAYGDFQWPVSGTVEAPDFDPHPCCGYGLHGLLWGEGDGGLLSWDDDAKWLVVEVEASAIVELAGKVKFPRGNVVFCGDRKGATDYINERRPGAIVGLSVSAGDSGTATAGYSGTATAGDYGTATAGDSGTATAGNRGTATAGDYGTATAGDYGTATAGDSGTATAGNRGTATAGDYGTATAGYSGTATAGNRGTATAGDSGTATAGKNGVLVLSKWDNKTERRRLFVAYVGENGIEPGAKYRLDEHDQFVKVEESKAAE